MFSLDFLSHLGKPSTRGFFRFFKATDHVGGAEAKMAVFWAMRDFSCVESSLVPGPLDAT